jgi:hypothetical protein
VIGALAIVVAVSGSAVATSGGHLTLGGKNHASKTTTIANPKGVALTLRAKAGSPPFSVGGNKTQVPSLDSSLLEGIAGPSLLGALHVYSTPGSHPITVPAGVHHVEITAIGGGGGGAGSGAGGGGGQGGYAVGQADVTPGEALTAQVGGGGSGGFPAGQGSPGRVSTVTFSTVSTTIFLLLAQGGNGGNASGTCPSGGAGGAGGEAQASTFASVAQFGAHGLAATDGAAGGSGRWGAHGTGPCPSKVRDSGAGAGAGFPGAGGDGGRTSGTNESTAGRDGAAGIVILEYLR